MRMPARHRFLLALALGVLAACGGTPKREPPAAPASAPAPGRPAYYKDDGPGDRLPADLDTLPDAVPVAEPLHRFANRPYTVFNREYVPATTLRPYRERGIASWYGRKFHGEKTATGDIYDMYAMTAAHPTLPLPSYARVTNVATGKSVVVRVNDRGPFLNNRVMDLSYAAAHRIGIAQRGSGEVEVEALVPANVTRLAAAPLPPVAAPVPAPALPPPVAAAPARDPMPVASAPAGFVVQLGAFANNANAKNFLEHVQNQLTAAQVEAGIRQVNGLFRVYVGPYADRDEARRVSQRLETAFGFATTLAPH